MNIDICHSFIVLFSGVQVSGDAAALSALKELQSCNALLRASQPSLAQTEAQRDAELVRVKAENARLKEQLRSLDQLAQKLNKQNKK